MFTEQVGLLEEIKTIDQVVEVLRFMLGNCQANLRHNGTLLMDSSRPDGATDAVLTVKDNPIAPDTLATESPRNGYAADFWGKVRFRGVVQFDQAVIGDNALAFVVPGMLIPWGKAVADIPAGFAICDGTANSVGNGGTGIDMRGQVPYGYSGAGDFATIGGTIATALSTTFSGTGNVTTSTDGNHAHEVEHESIQDAITISAHSASSGDANVSTAKDIWTVDDAPALPVFDGTTSPDSNYLSGDGDEVTTEGHDHNIAKSTIAGALADHTITAVVSPSSTFNTSTADAHSHTASISTIAGGLSIGTPSTVRPAGKVLAFIERLAT